MNTAALTLVLLIPAAPAVPAPTNAKPAVTKGLKWLAEQQKDEGNQENVFFGHSRQSVDAPPLSNIRDISAQPVSME